MVYVRATWGWYKETCVYSWGDGFVFTAYLKHMVDVKYFQYFPLILYLTLSERSNSGLVDCSQ